MSSTDAPASEEELAVIAEQVTAALCEYADPPKNKRLRIALVELQGELGRFVAGVLVDLMEARP
jgi:hypothetical protein